MAGIAPTEPAADAAAYENWLQAGMHGGMGYMARNVEARKDIRAWFPEARSVLVCAYSYGGVRAAPAKGKGRVARYAVREDYHGLLRERMDGLLGWLRTLAPSARGLSFCDTSPLLERYYARRAGIGWQGKNVMMISPKLGSYYLLAGLALNLELPSDEATADHCGTCTRCLDACPTDAFPKAHVLDASKCIAYLTIENKGPIPEALREGTGDWVFGCDICQEVCPWNRFETPARALPPAREPLELPLDELASLDDAAFKKRFKELPVSRAKRKGLLRSTLLAMGNSGDRRFVPTLERHASDIDPTIAEQARWSLARLESTIHVDS